MKQKMYIKTALLLALIIVVLSAQTGCGQSGGAGNTPPPENSDVVSETPSGSQDAPGDTEGPENTALPESSGAPSEADDDATAPVAGAPEPDSAASNVNVPTDTPAPGTDPSGANAPDAAAPSATPAPTPAAPTPTPVTPAPTPSPVPTPTPAPEPTPDNTFSSTTLSDTTQEVRFGDDGDPFTLYLYDNDTAAAIARHVGTADWRLPIYHYDDYANWEIMQYYDIPSNPERVTTVQAGAVYYSEPNRIILFYGDGEVSSEYTPVGYIDYSQELLDAVENNPVAPGWSNKLIHISIAD